MLTYVIVQFIKTALFYLLNILYTLFGPPVYSLNTLYEVQSPDRIIVNRRTIWLISLI